MSSPVTLRQLGAELHARLLAGASMTITSEIADVFLPAVTRSLRGEFPTLSDQHLVDTAVEDALIEYFNHPARFDPQRAGLLTYLRWRARSRLLNLLAGQKKLSAGEKVVEVEQAEMVYEMKESDLSGPEDALARREADETTLQKLREVFADPVDLEIVKLLMEGVRETESYAMLLGVSALSAVEQAGLVKRHKDRVKKTIRRKYRRGGAR